MKETQDLLRRVGMVWGLIVCYAAVVIGQEESGLQRVFPSDCSMSLPQEQVIISVDRNIYVGGELLMFQSYVLTDKKLISPLSKVLYVQIEDENNQVVAQLKSAIQNGIASGYFEIPGNIPSAIYRIHAFTNYSKNFGGTAGGFEFIKILNPVLPAKSISPSQTVDSISSDTGLVSGSYPGTLLDESPIKTSTRTQVRVSLDQLPESMIGHISIAQKIALKSHDRDLQKISSIFHEQLSDDSFSDLRDINLQYLPEHRGMYVSGIVREADSKNPVPDVLCQLTILGEVDQIHRCRTDRAGRFYMVVKEVYDFQQMHVGLVSSLQKEVEVLVDKDYNHQTIPYENILVDIEDEKLASYRRLVNYARLNRMTQLQEKVPESPSNIADPDITIMTADFVQLKTVEDIITDLLPNVYARPVDGRPGIVVYNEALEDYHKDPTILLDKVPITNLEALYEMSASAIERIDVKYNVNYLGDEEIRSTVAFYTKAGDFNGYPFKLDDRFFEYEGLQAPSAWKFSDELKGDDMHDQPDFRTTLLWQTARLIDRTSVVVFYTSDAVEEYELQVSGINDQGVYVSYILPITVTQDNR